MINSPPPLKGLNIRIPILIPVNRSGFINQGSRLYNHFTSQSPMEPLNAMQKPYMPLEPNTLSAKGFPKIRGTLCGAH